MKHLYLLLICFLVLGVGAQDSSSGESLSNSIRISQGDNISLNINKVDRDEVNLTLESSYSSHKIEFYKDGDNYESNEKQVQNLTFGNYTVADVSADDNSLDYSVDSYIEVEDDIEGSGRQRWYNSIIVNDEGDLSGGEAAYIAAVAGSLNGPSIDVPEGPMTAQQLTKDVRTQAAEQGWLEETRRQFNDLTDNNANLEGRGYYLTPHSSLFLPEGTPNREEVTAEDAEGYENIDVSDDCYEDVAYRAPPHREYDILNIPNADGGLKSSNQEPYSCPPLSKTGVPQEESELENPLTYCPEGMSEDACIDLRIEPSCQGDSRDSLCVAMLGEGDGGPGANAVLWQRYCFNQYHDEGLGLTKDEIISCIGPNYGRDKSDPATRTEKDITHGDVVRSFCESTPLANYNPENNMCEIGY